MELSTPFCLYPQFYPQFTISSTENVDRMSHPVYIKCRDDSCRHDAMVPVSALLKEYGEDITSDEVLRRARCTKCGFQGNNQMRLVYVGKSSLAQIGSAVNTESQKDVEVYW